MAHSKTLSADVYGIDANLIDVEVDYSGIVANEDHLCTVGLSDAAALESRDRVRAAIKNSGCRIPPTFTAINVAPADLKKEGRGFDPPIADGILCPLGAPRNDDLRRALKVGEWGWTRACVRCRACCRLLSLRARRRFPA